MAQFTRENAGTRGLNAALSRAIGTMIVVPAATYGAIEAEQKWNFFEDMDISDDAQMSVALLAILMGIGVGFLWGGLRQRAIYDRF